MWGSIIVSFSQPCSLAQNRDYYYYMGKTTFTLHECGFGLRQLLVTTNLMLPVITVNLDNLHIS